MGLSECVPQLCVQSAVDAGGLPESAVVREDHIGRGDGEYPGRAADEPSASAELVKGARAVCPADEGFRSVGEERVSLDLPVAC